MDEKRWLTASNDYQEGEMRATGEHTAVVIGLRWLSLLGYLLVGILVGALVAGNPGLQLKEFVATIRVGDFANAPAALFHQKVMFRVYCGMAGGAVLAVALYLLWATSPIYHARLPTPAEILRRFYRVLHPRQSVEERKADADKRAA